MRAMIQLIFMRKPLVFSLVSVVLITVFMWWFWSLGSIRLSVAEEITLHVRTAGVEVRSSNADWHAITGDTKLQASDEVRTNETGQATIRFFGIGETRLRERSQLRLEEARKEAQNGSVIVRLRLESGRVWSRVLRLFDLDSSFAVQTASVAATVRGTAFDMETDATGTSMWVSDAAVAMKQMTALSNTGTLMVPEGSMARMDAKGSHAMRPMTEIEKKSVWFLQNQAADDAFEQDAVGRMQVSLQQNTPAYPDSWVERFRRGSEWIHVAFSKQDDGTLQAAYLRRRLFAVKTLFDEEKSGLGLQVLGDIEIDAKRLRSAKNASSLIPKLRAVVAEYMLLLSDVPPSSPLYRLEQRLEDLYQAMSDSDLATTYYARLFVIDTHISAVRSLIDAAALEEAGIGLEGATQGLENVERDIRSASKDVTEAQKVLLQTKIDALRARIQSLSIVLQDALKTPTVDVQDTQTGAVTSTVGVPPVSGDATSTPGASDAYVQRLVVSAQPNPVYTSSTTVLRVIGVDAAGVERDVTTLAKFVLYGNIGFMQGSTYHATQAGSVMIEASVLSDGEVKKAQTTVQIKEAVVLSRLEIVPQGGTAVNAGQTLPVVVKAYYTGGVTSIVTNKVLWKSSDANVGSVKNGVFTAWINGQGAVVVTASYSEGGVTRTAELPLMVLPPTTR